MTSYLTPELMEHYRRPQYKQKPAKFNKSACALNELCGDRIELFLNVDNKGIIANAGYIGEGCILTLGATEIMIEKILGQNIKLLAIKPQDLIKDVPNGRKQCVLVALNVLDKALN